MYWALAVLWIGVVSVILFALVAADNATRSARDIVFARAASYAQLISSHNENTIRLAVEIVSDVAEAIRRDDLVAVGDARKHYLQDLLSRQWRRMPGIKAIRVVSESGGVVVGFGMDEATDSVAGKEYFAEAMESSSAVIVGSSIDDFIAEDYAIPVARRVSFDGSASGAIVLTLSAEDVFFPFYASLDLGKDSFVQLRTRSAVVTAFPLNAGRPASLRPIEMDPVSKMIGNGHQTGVIDTNGKEPVRHARAFHRIGGTNLYSVTGVSLKEATESAWYAFVAAIAVCVVALSAAIAATIVIRRLASNRKRLAEIAYNDPLTGLKSKQYLIAIWNKWAADALRSGGSLCLIVVDLDGFKRVNHALGYSNGDALLVMLAKRLRGEVGENDVVIRFGGDRFAVLHRTNGSDAIQDASRTCWRLLAAVCQPAEIAGRSIRVNGSAGAAVFPCHGETLEDISNRANLAVLRSKDSGKQMHTVYYQGLENGLPDTSIGIHAGLSEALEEGRFRLVFQPAVDLKSGLVVSAEARIRWEKSDGTVVAASSFIGAAEQSGIILPIGRWVVDEVCKCASRWMKAGLPPIAWSINLSALEFNQPTLEQHISTATSKHGLPMNILKLEIKESLLLSDNDLVEERIGRLAKMGVGLVVDDFGIGPSSIASLHKFAISEIKIDHSLAESLSSHSKLRPLLTAIVEMARAMDISTIAEGVETNDALHLFSELGYNSIQGNLVSRSLSYEGLVEFVREFHFQSQIVAAS